jgi:K+-transporting ATPase ATPase C chain
VAEARGLTVDEVIALIDENTVNPTLGFLNEPSVNVLLLNLALEERETSP